MTFNEVELSNESRKEKITERVGSRDNRSREILRKDKKYRKK